MGELAVVSRRHRCGEIGFTVHPSLWGRGLATAIGRSLLAVGFDDLQLHRIQATCDPRNVASARVLVKLGMTREGVLRHALHIRDGWRDSQMHSILRHEWPGPGGDR